MIDSGPYDLAIVPDDNRYAWLAKAAGSSCVMAFARDRPAWKNWMVDVPVPYPARPGAWADIAASSLAAAVVEPFRVGEWPRPEAEAIELPPSPFVVLHVGASTPLKRWVTTRWAALAASLRDDGMTIVWSAGPGERDVVEAIGVVDGDCNVAGRYDLAQLWQLLEAAHLLVCPDTGVAHLARLVGTPTVALFGPASSIVHGAGVFWADARFVVVSEESVPCRDQQVLFRRNVEWVRRCGRRFDASASPAGASDPGACSRALCMEAIAVDRVRAAIDRLLEQSTTAAR